MELRREDVINAMNREIAGEADDGENLQLARTNHERLMALGPVNGEWMIYTFRPVIGKLIVLVKRFFRKMLHGYIPRIVEDENARAELQNQVMLNLLCAMETMRETVHDLQERQKKAEAALHQGLDDELREQRKKLKRVEERLSQLEDRAAAMAESLQELRQGTDGLIRLSEDRASRLADQSDKLREDLEELRQRTEPLMEQHRREELDNEALASFPYSLFEDRFRGSVADIRERQSVYLEYFEGRKNVLDCGCGRGEFLSLLRARGIHAKGIDVSAEMIARCKGLGLNAEQADVFPYLESLPDHSLDGFFCSQVIEHLAPGALVRLIDLLRQKVQIGAPVVFETINPEVLPAVGNWFYMDLSHVRPVHPATLSFLLEVRGFAMQTTLYLHDNYGQKVPELKGKEGGSFNDGMARVNRMLFGPQDYAVVAYNTANEDGAV